MAKKSILFVLEGEERETDLFNNIADVFFNDKTEIVPVYVPVGINLYMFYDILRKSDFETDVVEEIRALSDEAKKKLNGYSRKDFAEIYYFFDFDEQSNNLHNKNEDNIDVLKSMLETLNNETELGKLYVSYPMIESFRDYVPSDCGVVSGGCFRNRNEFGTYKRDSSKEPKNNKISDYDFVKWKGMLENYIYRASCLFGINELDRDSFINEVTPANIFDKEIHIYKKSNCIFILSCLPEFLIDYFKNCWDAPLKKRKRPINKKGCDKKPN